MSNGTEAHDKLQALMDETKEATEVTITRDRYGYRIDGQFYRRVTTLCGGLPKPWLGSWAAKMVAEFAVEHRESWMELPKTDAIKLLKGAPWSKRDEAGIRGTAVHDALDGYIKGLPFPKDLTGDEEACATSATRFLKERGSRVLASELTVYSPTHGYAGTLDLWELTKEDGSLGILDWKTSKSVYAEHGVQLAAYQNAEFAIVNKRAVGNGGEKWTGLVIPWGPDKCEYMGVVHVRPDGATLHPIVDAKRLWTVFRAAAHVKMWQLDTDSFAGKAPRAVVFGEPTTVPNEGGESDESR